MPFDAAVFHEIESAEFAVELGLSGSLTRAYRALVRLPQTEMLFTMLEGDVNAGRAVAERIRTLIERDVDMRYTHPSDVAITAYVTVLDIIFPRLAYDICTVIARHQLNLWRAIPVIRRVLQTTVPSSVMDYKTEFYSLTDVPLDAGTNVLSSEYSVAEVFLIPHDAEVPVKTIPVANVGMSFGDIFSSKRNPIAHTELSI